MTASNGVVTADMVSIEVREVAVVARLIVSEITYPTGELYHKALLERSQSGKPANFVLELSNLRLLSSQGLNVLLLFLKRVNQCGGRLTLAGLGGHPLTVMRAVGLTRGFDLYPDANIALEALRLKMAGHRGCPGIERRSGNDSRSGQDRREGSPKSAGAERRARQDRRGAVDRRGPL